MPAAPTGATSKTDPAIWRAVRLDYFKTGDKASALALRHGVSLEALANKMTREHWVDARVEAMKAEPIDAYQAAKRFVQSTLLQVSHFTDIMTQRVSKCSDRNVGIVTNAWQTAVTEGRRALGLDQQAGHGAGLVTVNVVGSAQVIAGLPPAGSTPGTTLLEDASATEPSTAVPAETPPTTEPIPQPVVSDTPETQPTSVSHSPADVVN